MRRQKTNLILLFAILIITLVSCGLDPSGSSDKNTPLDPPVISTTVVPEVHGAENWFSEPFDVTFSFNQKARISYSVNYWDETGMMRPETHTVEGQSVTIHCDRKCDINVSASTGNSMQSSYFVVRYKDLDRVSVSYDNCEPVTEGKLVVLLLDYRTFVLKCGSDMLPEWMGDDLPVIRYTIDGTDPHTSSTAREFKTSRNPSFEDQFPYEEGMTQIRAYAYLDGWKSAEDTVIDIEVAKTENPVLNPGDEDDIIDYGQRVAFTAGAGSNCWYTTNADLTTDDITDDCWDPSTGWVRCYVTDSIPAPEGQGSFKLRVVARDEGKLFSDIVEGTFRVQLPAPVKQENETEVDGQIKVIFTREGGPNDSIPVCYVNGKETDVTKETAYRFSVIVDSGSKISVKLTKDGYVDSERTVVQPMIKLAKPTADIAYKGETKYRLVTLKSTDEGVTIHYILNGVEKTYTTPIEIRQTTTITAWAEKENYQQSDNNPIKVTVKYDIGDRGPAGGTIVHAAGEGSYYELAPTVITNVIFGYFATKDGGRPQMVEAFSDDGYGSGQENTEKLRAMVGHTYASATVKAVSGTTTDAFAIKKVLDYSASQTINGEVVTFDDWYLPSRSEMEGMLRRQRDHEEGLDSPYLLPDVMYWCSTESDSSTTMTYVKWSTKYLTGINAGTQSRSMKNNCYAVMLRRF